MPVANPIIESLFELIDLNMRPRGARYLPENAADEAAARYCCTLGGN